MKGAIKALLLCSLVLTVCITLHTLALYYSSITYHASPRIAQSFWASNSKVHTLYSQHNSGGTDNLPVIIPGPLDRWGGNKSKEVIIDIPFTYDVEVTLFFPDSHESVPPQLEVTYGYSEKEIFDVQQGAGQPISNWPSKGKPSTLTFNIAKSRLLESDIVTLKTITGSWVGLSQIRVNVMPAIWKYLVSALGWIFCVSLFLWQRHYYTTSPTAGSPQSRDNAIDGETPDQGQGGRSRGALYFTNIVTSTPAVFVMVLIALLWISPNWEYFFSESSHGLRLGSASLTYRYGMFPFVDYFFIGGPLLSITSAFGFLIYDNLLSEILICSIGYALALSILYSLLKKEVAHIFAFLFVLIPITMPIVLYQWYYWMSPLAALYIYRSTIYSTANQRIQWIFLAGLLTSIAGLFRIDMLVLLLVFYLLTFTTASFCTFCNPPLRHWVAPYALSMLLPFGVWFMALYFIGGTSSIYDYVSTTFLYAAGTVARSNGAHDYFSLLHFTWEHPLSRHHGIAWGKLIILVVNMWAILQLFLYKQSAEANKKYSSLIIFASGLLSMGLFLEAVKGNKVYLIMVSASIFYFSFAMLLSALWTGRVLPRNIARSSIYQKTMFLVLIAIFASAWYPMSIEIHSGAEHSSMTSFNLNPIDKYKTILSNGKNLSEIPKLEKVARYINKISNKNDTLLIISNKPQLYYFTKLKMSGVYPGYMTLYRFNDEIINRNTMKIKSSPPDIVITGRKAHWVMDKKNSIYFVYKDLYKYIDDNYTLKAHMYSYDILVQNVPDPG